MAAKFLLRPASPGWSPFLDPPLVTPEATSKVTSAPATPAAAISLLKARRSLHETIDRDDQSVIHYICINNQLYVCEGVLAWNKTFAWTVCFQVKRLLFHFFFPGWMGWA
uniref:Uncharacterized protein n=1 Tax=Setaria viridis TaxID=4556 RepID=A0A4U6TLN0_SETVI|nr:hypothetical protein SEVIR_8G226300v2 [Setaria viridis]